MKLLAAVRTTIARNTSDLFTHARYPLAHSLEYRGDPGMFGPGSPTWEITGDVAMFIGGIRALLIQTVNPEVVAGVDDHSLYDVDPLGRLSRTSAYVTATAYGAIPEVDEAIARVRQAHVPVKGVSHRGRSYSAARPEHAAWVHNVLTDSFLTAYRVFGPSKISGTRADQYVAEQAELGRMLQATDLPDTAAALESWIVHHPDIEASPAMTRTTTFLMKPPLPGLMPLGYRILVRAAAATIPPRVAATLDLSQSRFAISRGRRLASLLRWSLGSSPSWWLALERTGSPVPRNVHFQRPPPVEGVEDIFNPS